MAWRSQVKGWLQLDCNLARNMHPAVESLGLLSLQQAGWINPLCLLPLEKYNIQPTNGVFVWRRIYEGKSDLFL